MSKDNFQWTDELVLDFLFEGKLNMISLKDAINEFKKEKSKPIEKERMEIISNIFRLVGYTEPNSYGFATNDRIPEEKLSTIKQVIEDALNK